ncbi:MAG: glycosyltransferase [Streptosporangiales bacterium]|nr:glycosyltransferase [Streptosporangiales bacterium]
MSPPLTPARLTVVIGTDTYPGDVNGAAHFTHRLATGLAARGHRVSVVCGSDQGPPRTHHVDGVTVHRLRSMPLLVHPTMRAVVPDGVTRRIARLISEVRPDVVHVQGHFTVGRAALRAARQAGVRTVATNHFMPENLQQYLPLPPRPRAWLGELLWRDFRRVFARAGHVTTPTLIAAELLAAHGFHHPVEPVSCGIDLGRFRPRTGAPPRARFHLPERDTALFVGRLDAEKSLDTAVRALPAAGDLQLVLAGTGNQRAALERLVARLGVGDRVFFLGHVPDAELPLVYAAADVFVMPGIAELQSIATLEAMASGLPVVAADAVALPHLVRPGHNGRLFAPGDAAALAGHLRDILGTPGLRTAMGRAGRAAALRHDHQRSLDHFERIYRGQTTAVPSPLDARARGAGLRLPRQRAEPDTAARVRR